jgi:hypothetical protein
MVPVLPDDLPHADYWRQRHASMAFAGQHGSYNDYEPAYRYGAERSRELPGASFSEQELLLSQGWREFKGDSRLLWDAARPAVRHAWNRAQPRTPANVAANCGPCGVPIDLT